MFCFNYEKNFYDLRLPSLLNDAIDEIASATQAPRPLVLSAVVGAAAAAVQSGFRLEIEKGHDEPLGLLMLIIAPSGEGKTPVFQAAFAGLREFEARMGKRYEEALESYSIESSIWQSELKGQTKQLENAVRKSDEKLQEYWRSKIKAHKCSKPVHPKKIRMLFADTTPAALLKVLDAGSRAFAVIEDEGSRILHGELSKAFGTLLKAWDGKLLESNRVEGGDIYLPDPRMVYVVAIQQGGFEQFVLKKGEVAQDIGLFARCLPVWPPSVQGYRQIGCSNKSTLVQTRFKEFILEMLEQQFQNGSFESVASEKVLTLSYQAKVVWQDTAQRIEYAMREGGEFFQIRSFASKMAANAARLAGVLHLFSEKDSLEIDHDSMSMAFDLMYCFMREHMRIFAFQSPQQIVLRRAKKLEDWLLKKLSEKQYIHDDGFGKCYMKKSTVLKNAPSELRHALDLNAALEVLCGFCRISHDKINRQEVIVLNPNFFLPRLAGTFPAGFLLYA